jgi:hypothetical protein
MLVVMLLENIDIERTLADMRAIKPHAHSNQSNSNWKVQQQHLSAAAPVRDHMDKVLKPFSPLWLIKESM